MTVENGERPTDDDAGHDPFGGADDAADSLPVTTLFGAVGQLSAAVLVVVVLVALFIGGAMVFRWIFG